MITNRDLLIQRELIQKEIVYLLKDLNDNIRIQACDIVVKRFNILLDKLTEGN